MGSLAGHQAVTCLLQVLEHHLLRPFNCNRERVSGHLKVVCFEDLEDVNSTKQAEQQVILGLLQHLVAMAEDTRPQEAGSVASEDLMARPRAAFA